MVQLSVGDECTTIRACDHWGRTIRGPAPQTVVPTAEGGEEQIVAFSLGALPALGHWEGLGWGAGAGCVLQRSRALATAIGWVGAGPISMI